VDSPSSPAQNTILRCSLLNPSQLSLETEEEGLESNPSQLSLETEEEGLESNPSQLSLKTSATKKARPTLEWRPVQVVLLYEEVDAYIKAKKAENDGISIIADKLNRRNKLSLDIVSYYKCGGFRRYGCSYMMKIVKHADIASCHVVECGVHFHTNANPTTAGIPQHLKPQLLEGVQMSSKPAKIYRKLKKSEPFSKITQKQVQQAVLYLRKKEGSVLKQNTIGYLYEWLAKNELNIASAPHTVGVLPGWRATGPCNIEDSTVNIHFVLTTKTLLYRIVEQAACSFGQFITVDGTYSLLDIGFPVLKLGTVDALHRYADVCLCISRHEDEAAFHKMILSVKEAVFMFYNFVMKPICSVPDKARSIFNALQNIFPATETYPGIKIAICYFHNKQAIETNKGKFSSEEKKIVFSKDVEQLHALTSTDAVENALLLFAKKWARKEKEATAWYMKEWGLTNFHASATPPGAPVANCSMESSNRVLKQNVTNHERLAMGNFLSKVVEEWAFQSTEAENFPLSLLVKNDRPRFGMAQLWLKATKAYIRESSASTHRKVYYIPSSDFLGENPNPSLQQLRDGIWNCNNKTVLPQECFDEYISRVTAFYIAKPLEAAPNGENFFSCSCPYYWKYETCKHSLGLSLWKKKLQVPNNYDVENIQQLKKRGRPKKVTNFMHKENP
jgi:hypothetical protein